MCFYVQERNVHRGAYTGHAFVQMLPNSGPQAGDRNLVYGFYPKDQWLAITGSAGKIETDNKHGWEWKLCKSVTTDEYNKAESTINADRKSTPRYSLGGFNCTDWMYKIAKAASVKLPPANALGTGLLDPERLAQEYKKLYAEQGGRNIPGGDAVWKNTENVWPNSVKDPPSPVIDLSSYTDITLLSFIDPPLIAHGLDMTARTATLPTVTVGANHALRIELAGLGTKPTVTEVHFGDGSREYQKHTFTHSYSQPGTYRLVGIAIANATVFRFGLQVAVVRDGGEASTTITVPFDSPRHYRFPAPQPVTWPLPL